MEGYAREGLCDIRNGSNIVCRCYNLACMDNIPTVIMKSVQGMRRGMATRFKARRLAMNLTQEGLASRAGMSWSSLKRFEYTGLISLESLLKLALILGCLDDFDGVCKEDGSGLEEKSLDAIMDVPKPRGRGRIK